MFFISLFVIAQSTLITNEANSNTSGPPSGRTGAPGELNCTSCHAGTVNSGSGINTISTNIPSSGFIGGETYTITLSTSQVGISKFGFQVTAVNGSGSKIGSWIITNSTETQINSTNWVNQKSAGTSGSGSKTWTVDWKAPCAGQDTVIFHAAFNATNSNSSTGGDFVYTRAVGYTENLINSADTLDILSVIDNGNNYDGRDLRVRFRTSKCESRTSEYRLMAVKAANAASFTKSDALLVTDFVSVPVTSSTPNSTINRNFGSNGKDVDGDPIQNNQPYRVFILSMAKTSLVSNDTLFQHSSDITLTSPTATVSNIIAADSGETGNGSDLFVQFITPNNEATIGEYRTIVVKDSKASVFTIADADTLPSSLYKLTNTGTPGTQVDISYNAGDMDSDGDTLKPLTEYRVFVLVKADGVNSISDDLQMAGDSVVLSEPPPSTVGITEPLEDIGIIKYSHQWEIWSKGIQDEPIEINVYSMEGKIIFKDIIAGSLYRLNLLDIPSRAGIISLRRKNEVLNQKFVR